MKLKIFEPFSEFLFHEFFDRSIDARKNPEKIASACGIESLIFANQTHSKNVFSLHKNDLNNAHDPLPNIPIENVDAFVTNQRGSYLMIRSADCQAILICDPITRTVAAIHSGWRGSVQNILNETLHVMVDEFACIPANLHAAVSPSLGPCCQIFSDPFHELPESFHGFVHPNLHVNFWDVTKAQFSAAGIPENHIEFSNICTSCSTKSYFSYRKEGPETGRFASVIGLV